MQDINWFDELFYSVELWGYLGPLALVFIGAVITEKNKSYGVMWYIILMFMTLYFYLPDITTYYIQVFIMLLGGALTCIVPQMSRS